MKHTLATLIVATLAFSATAKPMDFAEANTLTEEELAQEFCAASNLLTKNVTESIETMSLTQRILIRKFKRVKVEGQDLMKCKDGKFVSWN